jgi:Protein of unknown function (DUF2490)
MYKILLLLLLVVQTSFAQTSSRPVYPDAGLWNTLNVSMKLNKRTTALFTQELRLRENYSRLNLLYTNLGLGYNLGKGFKAALIYRFIDKYLETNQFSFRHRIMLDLSYKRNWNNFEASYRHRAQLEWRDYYSSILGKSPEIFSRNKFEFTYTIGKWMPNYSSEFRVQFTDPRNNADDDNISRNRNIFGVDYQLNKFSVGGLYFLYQKEFNTATPQIIYITGLEYKIDLSKLQAQRKEDKRKKNKKNPK